MESDNKDILEMLNRVYGFVKAIEEPHPNGFEAECNSNRIMATSIKNGLEKLLRKYGALVGENEKAE